MPHNPVFFRKGVKRSLLFSYFFGLAFFIALTKSSGAEKSDAPFNPSEIIFEHIGDSHHWNLFGGNNLPLPMIIYTDKGLEFFSSAPFYAGAGIYQGRYSYKLVSEKVRVVSADGSVDEAASKKVLDFSITKNVASLFVSFLALLLLFIPIANAYKKRSAAPPKGLQSALEPIILFVRDEIAIPNLGAGYLRYMPLLLSLFFFIWMNNLLGLIPFFPGGANLTGNIAVTFTLAIITFIVVQFSGKKSYWGHIFLPKVPWPLYILMVPIEIVGIFTKPFALMIRLFANITAGHVLVLSLISLIFIFKTVWVASVSVPFAVFISIIELLVGFLQAFIFTILAALFIGSAAEEHAEH